MRLRRARRDPASQGAFIGGLSPNVPELALLFAVIAAIAGYLPAQ